MDFVKVLLCIYWDDYVFPVLGSFACCMAFINLHKGNDPFIPWSWCIIFSMCFEPGLLIYHFWVYTPNNLNHLPVVILEKIYY
jgi:hypothetical protein